MSIKKRKLLAVASAGGHWTQLKLLDNAFASCDVRYVTTHKNRRAQESADKIELVIDADLSGKLKLLLLAIQTLILVLRHRPDVIVSTGAAPGFFAVLFGKLIRARTVWIDSMANYSSLSVSGHYASKICDLCLTQWPALSEGSNAQYWGALLE